MAFEKKYYKELKKFMDKTLSGVPFQLVDRKPDITPYEWVETFLPLVVDCEHREDYEGAKAIKDAIMDFLNKYLSDDNKITEFDMLKLPEYKSILPVK